MYIYQLHIPLLGTKEEMELLEERFLRKQYHPDSAAAEKEQENCPPEVESCLEKGLALYIHVCVMCVYLYVYMCVGIPAINVLLLLYSCVHAILQSLWTHQLLHSPEQRGKEVTFFSVHMYMYSSQAISSIKLHVFLS